MLPRLTCPHCNAQTIDAADKLEGGMFGPPCKCSGCGGYSRELKWPRLRLSLMLYVAPYLILLTLLGLWQSTARNSDEATIYALIVLGAVMLLWQCWLAGVVEALLSWGIPLRPVTPNRWWRYWAIFKSAASWAFWAMFVGTFLFTWWANRH